MARSRDMWDRLLVTGGGLVAAAPEAASEWLGRRVGAFELVELIGQGGMGAVYLGRRVDRQFEQRVAVKILSERLRATTHRDRFRRERQIIADLDHPSIARIIDGGVSAEERPYLVMEYVPGVAIDRYCDGLPPARCLELMVKVCDAVAHAHERGVIHQDLKPGNILINERGDPKLLDFGIAAAGREDEPFGLFTPLYAAPEQVLNGPSSTATDVYQLGLLLFRLLTGGAAFGGAGADLATLRERILSQPPPRPSRFARLPRGWRAELDAIVARCLQKDPRQRYPGVAGLREDLRAIIEHRPVTAITGGAAYRVMKWARRRAGMLAAGAAVVLLVAGLSGLYWQQMREQRAAAELSADRAAAASELLADILESIDPLAGGTGGELGEVISTSGFELSAARRYRPEVRREIVLMTAQTLLDLGRFEDVIKMVEPLVTELGDALDPVSEYAEYLSLLGYARYRAGELEQGLSLLDEALVRQSADPGVAPEALATTLQRLALAERRAARPERARAHLERALELLTAELSADDVRLAQAHSHLGLVLTDLGLYPQAIASFDRADSIYARAPGDHELRRAMTLGNLADVERLAGRLVSAEDHARRAVELAAGARAQNPQLLATAHVALGNVLISGRRYPEAAEQYGQAHAIYRQELGPDHPRLALVAHNLGVSLRLQDRCDEALPYFDEAIRIGAASYPADHPELVESRRQRDRCAGP